MIKKISILLFVILIVIICPRLVLAHGGVENKAGNVLVTLFQTPLSPLTGENVNFAFILTDQTKSHFLKNKQARIVVTQTTVGDPSKDTVVFTQEVKSNTDGIINFSYTFPHTNYYDIDLEFGKPNDESNTTGFLVQPRENLQNNVQYLEIFVVISLILNFVFLFYLFRNLLRTIRS
jgi:hypothetical protein